MHTYNIEASNDNCEITYKTNNITNVLSAVRDLWNQDFHKIHVTNCIGVILFDFSESKDIYISPEIKLMLDSFLRS